jgi:soluble lytic murein transglycosylase-like protein
VVSKVVEAAKPVEGAEELAKYLPSNGKKWAGQILTAAKAKGVDPVLLAAVIEQESSYGDNLSTKGPDGTGDNGHGHGVAQIDDRTWGDWLKSNNWKDFLTNATKGAEILRDGLKAFSGNVRAGTSAYNAGPGRVRAAIARGQDPGTVTTHSKAGESYPDGIARRMALMKERARKAGVA